jgi:Protein of unknown function (DUF2630)
MLEGCWSGHEAASLPVVDDQDIFARIQALVDEEHQLREDDAEEHQGRIADLEVTLDQCWDLLRQRRARRHAHLDPEEAAVRDETVVERYQQ